jgi:hypothetical protein
VILSYHAFSGEVGAGFSWWAFACSHGGDVVCVEGAGGRVRWRTALKGRCEAGLSVLPDLRYLLSLTG